MLTKIVAFTHICDLHSQTYMYNLIPYFSVKYFMFYQLVDQLLNEEWGRFPNGFTMFQYLLSPSTVMF